MSVISIDTEKLQKIKNYERLFWPKVLKTDSCWLWQSGLDHEGRARITIGGGPNKISISAARYLMMLRLERILSEKECVLHTCDNKVCVNPDHLWIGTKAENNRDRSQKQRSARLRGSINGNSKLSEQIVRRIKFGNEPASKLAYEFRIHVTTIYYIRNGKLWGHIHE